MIQKPDIFRRFYLYRSESALSAINVAVGTLLPTGMVIVHWLWPRYETHKYDALENVRMDGLLISWLDRERD